MRLVCPLEAGRGRTRRAGREPLQFFAFKVPLVAVVRMPVILPTSTDNDRPPPTGHRRSVVTDRLSGVSGEAVQDPSLPIGADDAGCPRPPGPHEHGVRLVDIAHP